MRDDEFIRKAQEEAARLGEALGNRAEQMIVSAVKGGAVNTEKDDPSGLARLCLIVAGERAKSGLSAAAMRQLSNLRHFV